MFFSRVYWRERIDNNVAGNYPHLERQRNGRGGPGMHETMKPREHKTISYYSIGPRQTAKTTLTRQHFGRVCVAPFARRKSFSNFQPKYNVSSQRHAKPNARHAQNRPRCVHAFAALQKPRCRVPLPMLLRLAPRFR